MWARRNRPDDADASVLTPGERPPAVADGARCAESVAVEPELGEAVVDVGIGERRVGEAKLSPSAPVNM